jgi:hypothetical protein
VRVVIDKYRCRTRSGVFKLVFNLRAGCHGWALFVDDRFVEFFFHLDTATGTLARGELDKALGFSTAGLGIPASVENWIGFS